MRGASGRARSLCGRSRFPYEHLSDASGLAATECPWPCKSRAGVVNPPKPRRCGRCSSFSAISRCAGSHKAAIATSSGIAGSSWRRRHDCDTLAARDVGLRCRRERLRRGVGEIAGAARLRRRGWCRLRAQLAARVAARWLRLHLGPGPRKSPALGRRLPPEPHSARPRAAPHSLACPAPLRAIRRR